MTSSITVEPYETVEFSDSDTDSWQVVDPFDSENDDVITTESDVITSDEDDVDEEEDVDVDVDVVVDDVIPTESDVISSEDDDEDEDEEEDDDEDDVISSDEDDDEEDDDVITSEDEEEEEEDEDDVITSEDEEEEEDEDDVITPMSSDEITNHTQGLNKAAAEFEGLYNVEISDSMKEDLYYEHIQLERALYKDDVEEEEEDEDEDDYDEEDLDDELIPRWLNNKFERQRMRKLGKKVYPKMKKSKRMVNQYNRPGCAGAKHGLGLKHNLI